MSSSSELKQHVAFRLGAYFWTSPWMCMSLAICFELFGTIHAKLSNGLTLHMPTSIMYICYMTSVSFLALALDTSSSSSSSLLQQPRHGLDLGVAYATWSGLGTIVAALYGVLQAGERLNTAQWAGLVLTSIGITLVNVAPAWSWCSFPPYLSYYNSNHHDGHSDGVAGEQEHLLNATNTATPAPMTYGYYTNDNSHDAVGHV